jgi:hypothetical protein
MKFTFAALAIIVTLCSLNAEAQLKKGEKMLGATINFSGKETENVGNTTFKTTTFQLQPSIGFGVGKNWIVGGLIGYNYTSQKIGGPALSTTTETKINVYSLGAWVRKFYPLGNQFGFYGQSNVSAGFGKAKKITSGSNYTPKADVNALVANIQPGFYFHPGKKVILEATFGVFGYSSTEQDYEAGAPYYDVKNSEFNFSITEGLSLGVKFVL